MNYYICPRCNGNRIIDKYKHVDNGICFECSGSGKVTGEEKNRIEKEIAKETKRQNTRQNKFIDSLKNQWFHGADTIYIIDNNDTYLIKDKIKHDGAYFNNSHKVWYFTEVKKGYDLFKISWDEIGDKLAISLQEIIQEKSKSGLKGY